MAGTFAFLSPLQTECQPCAFSLNLHCHPYLAPSSDLQVQPEQANPVTSLPSGDLGRHGKPPPHNAKLFLFQRCCLCPYLWPPAPAQEAHTEQGVS